MASVFEAADWPDYRMDTHNPFAALEPAARERQVVGEALAALAATGIIPDTNYDESRLLAHRNAVHGTFEIPWTAITPRQERLIWALNAISRPARLLAAGIFCGFTFICNAGAAVGPGAVYQAWDLVGVEIRPEEAARAERNVRRLDPSGVARILAADAVDVAAGYEHPLHLLYLDADGAGGRGKGVYLDILEAAYDKMPAGSLVLAHNSVNLAERLQHYLRFVRDPAHFRASVNVVLDGEGLEVSAK